MPKPASTLSVFALEGVLVDIPSGESISACTPSRLTGSEFRRSVGDKNAVTVVVSDRDSRFYTETWMWLHKHFRVISGPRPTYLIMRDAGIPAPVLAIQTLKTMLVSNPSCNRISVLEKEDAIISSYRDFISGIKIPFWRIQKVSDGTIVTSASSFVDHS